MLKIFLDLNHWIALSKAYYGMPDHPKHIEALSLFQSKIRKKEVILPLQISHLVEFSRHSNEARRKRMAFVFEELSQRWFFAPWSAILPYELSVAISRIFDTQETIAKPEIFGKGALFSVSPSAKQTFIENKKLKMEFDFYELLSSQPGALFDLLTFPNEDGRKKQLFSDRKRRIGYAADCEQLRDRNDSLDLSRRAQAASYTIEHQEELQRRLLAAGKTFFDFKALGPTGMSDFFDEVPSLDVDRTLCIFRDRQWNRRIDDNDMNDIGYLSKAIPYCDVVLVENLWAHAIRTQGLDEKYNTKVFTNLKDLVDYFNG